MSLNHRLACAVIAHGLLRLDGCSHIEAMRLIWREWWIGIGDSPADAWRDWNANGRLQEPML